MTGNNFNSLILLPVIITETGKYKTRCGETVTITKATNRNWYSCEGYYDNGIEDFWHRSGRLYASELSNNDIVGKVD